MTKSLSIVNDWKAYNLSKNRTTIDKLVKKYKLLDLDFIKLDTDDHEFDILVSASDIIKTAPVLGIQIEISFHGCYTYKDSFWSIDRKMREFGFELVDLAELRRYSSEKLPMPFYFPAIGQTVDGRLYQGDALYLRDPDSTIHGSPACPFLIPDKLLKLACLYEIFNMPDMAAEILILNRSVLENKIDVDENLDLLTKSITQKNISYQSYMEILTAPEMLYPEGPFGKNRLK